MCRNNTHAAPAPARPRIAVPAAANLEGLSDGWRTAFASAARRFADVGADIVETDIAPLLEAATLLYSGAYVAYRYAAVGEHLHKHTDEIGTGLDPTVAAIILAAQDITAADLAADRVRLTDLAGAGRDILDGVTALLTPTTTWHPTLDQVAADPFGANARMGAFTNFANLLDLASLAIPAGVVDGLPFGVMLTGAAFSDRALAELARRFASPGIDLFVVGAHLTGQPLNRQLVEAGGTLVTAASTARGYRLYALDTSPPKPGLVRVGAGGVSVPGEVWRLPADGFGTFVAAIPAPMAIGKVTLGDGTAVSGFLVEPVAVEGAKDISDTGGWRNYLAARPN